MKLGKSEVPRKLFVLKKWKSSKNKERKPDGSTRIRKSDKERKTRYDLSGMERHSRRFGETNKNALLGQLAKFGRGIAERMTG